MWYSTPCANAWTRKGVNCKWILTGFEPKNELDLNPDHIPHTFTLNQQSKRKKLKHTNTHRRSSRSLEGIGVTLECLATQGRCSGVAIPQPTPTLQYEVPNEEEMQGRREKSRRELPHLSSVANVLQIERHFDLRLGTPTASIHVGGVVSPNVGDILPKCGGW